MKGVCFVSFSSKVSFSSFFAFQKPSRSGFSPFVWRERWLLVKGASKASKVPSFSPSKASKPSKRFEGSFEALVLTFEGFEGFLPFGAPPPPPAPRPLRPLDLRRLRRLGRSRRGRVPGTSPTHLDCFQNARPSLAVAKHLPFPIEYADACPTTSQLDDDCQEVELIIEDGFIVKERPSTRPLRDTSTTTLIPGRQKQYCSRRRLTSSW